jgi:hypothetical protein
LANTAGGPEHLVDLSAESMLQAARDSTGLGDFGPTNWREGFELLIADLNNTADLTLVGRLLARQEIIRSLQALLLVTEDYHTHPEIEEEKIDAPIFVTGMGRAGTTVLHELLAEDPQFRIPLTWELLYPSPAPVAETRASDPRIAIADADHTIWAEVTPEYRTMHENRGDAPNECILGTLHNFTSQVWGFAHDTPNYDAWHLLGDHSEEYRFHRRLLKVLQFRAPGRWMLKGPTHLFSLPALFQEYPDARVVTIHRDPLKSLPSTVSLFALMRWQRSERVDYDGLVQLLATAYPMALDALVQQRADGTLPDDRIVDVRYGDLMSDPVSAMADLYSDLDLEFTAGHADRVKTYLAAKPKDRHGAHRYSFDDLGLDMDTVRAAFRNYQQTYGVEDES